MWPNPQETADLITFTEENRNGKLHFIYSVTFWEDSWRMNNDHYFYKKFYLDV